VSLSENRVVREKEIKSFTYQRVMLGQCRKVRENGQPYRDKLHDLYNSFQNGKSSNFYYWSSISILDQWNMKIIHLQRENIFKNWYSIKILTPELQQK
jgi:hypothetical protein